MQGEIEKRTRVFFGRLFQKKVGEAAAPQNEDIRERLLAAKSEMDDLRANFDNIGDETLLDMYIYKLKAAEAEYKHLLDIMKEKKRFGEPF